MPLSIETLTSALADRYRIERELGSGGMATVFLARDLRDDRRGTLLCAERYYDAEVRL